MAKPEIVIGKENKPDEVILESKTGKVKLRLRYVGGST